jgi:hypothetical protein
MQSLPKSCGVLLYLLFVISFLLHQAECLQGTYKSPFPAQSDVFESITKSWQNDLINIFANACDANCCGQTAAATRQSSLPCCQTCDNLVYPKLSGLPFALPACDCPSGDIQPQCCAELPLTERFCKTCAFAEQPAFKESKDESESTKLNSGPANVGAPRSCPCGNGFFSPACCPQSALPPQFEPPVSEFPPLTFQPPSGKPAFARSQEESESAKLNSGPANVGAPRSCPCGNGFFSPACCPQSALPPQFEPPVSGFPPLTFQPPSGKPASARSQEESESAKLNSGPANVGAPRSCPCGNGFFSPACCPQSALPPQFEPPVSGFPPLTFQPPSGKPAFARSQEESESAKLNSGSDNIGVFSPCPCGNGFWSLACCSQSAQPPQFGQRAGEFPPLAFQPSSGKPAFARSQGDSESAKLNSGNDKIGVFSPCSCGNGFWSLACCAEPKVPLGGIPPLTFQPPVAIPPALAGLPFNECQCPFGLSPSPLCCALRFPNGCMCADGFIRVSCCTA